MALSIAIEDLKAFWLELKELPKKRFDETPGRCPNCSVAYVPHENFCYHCGEQKANRSRDFSVYTLFMELLIEVILINRRLFLTGWGLMCRPGILTRANFLGVRNKFYRPLTILSAMVALFYLFFANTTFFYAGITEMHESYQQGITTSNLLKYNIGEKLAEKSELIHRSVKDIIGDTERRAEAISQKSFWVIWPLLALLLSSVIKGPYLNYTYHLVSAAHLFGAYLFTWLATCLIFFKAADQVQIMPEQTAIVNALFIVYLILHIKGAYLLSYRTAIWKGLITAAGFYMLIILFRQALTIASFLSINS